MEIKSRHIHIVLEGKSFGSCWICVGEDEVKEASVMIPRFLVSASEYISREIETLASWKKSYDQPRQHIKQQKHHFADKGLYSQSYGFSGSHV